MFDLLKGIPLWAECIWGLGLRWAGVWDTGDSGPLFSARSQQLHPWFSWVLTMTAGVDLDCPPADEQTWDREARACSWACTWRSQNSKRYLCPDIHCSTVHSRAKTWRQSRCASTHEWIKVWYTYTMEYYSAVKKNEIMSCAATRTDLEIVILSEVRTEKDKYLVILLICGILKNCTNGLQDRNHHRYRKQTWLPGEKGLGRDETHCCC